MPRRPRDNVARAVYHVTARGNNHETIFFDDADRFVYLRMLTAALQRFSMRLFAYVLMTNHVHLLTETLQPNISVAVHHLHGTYAKYVNRRHGRWGHVFGQRFWSKIIDDDAHFLELSRYIPRNPVRAGLVADPIDYPWSSCAAYVGLDDTAIVDTGPVLELMVRNPTKTPAEFLKFVSERIRK